ncbi:MAG: Hpt domain-containing protein [Prochloraceae cyanobacterium]|nr:Hpt domain-containing protein [Prochloraceae cyanobacterium]
MDTTSQQRLLGYFIEEAKEHLETLEKGILELSSVIEDNERVNEMFRAAHSIKGGAAMLGYGSIQNAAHRLEDAFKIIKENPIEVDQRLESLFLRAYDVLQNLVTLLESAMELEEDQVEGIMQEAEPYFVELQEYLNQLLGEGGKAVPQAASIPEQPALNLSEPVKETLKQMLQLFKQKASPESRQQLLQLCDNLAELAPQERGWQEIIKKAKDAIANPKHSYRTLAPVTIKELKQANDYLELGKGELIAPSQSLQQLASASLPQVLITVEPKTAANTLSKVFNRQEISQLIEYLQVGS